MIPLKIEYKDMINVDKYMHSLAEIDIVKKTGTMRIKNSINLSTVYMFACFKEARKAF